MAPRTFYIDQTFATKGAVSATYTVEIIAATTTTLCVLSNPYSFAYEEPIEEEKIHIAPIPYVPISTPGLNQLIRQRDSLKWTRQKQLFGAHNRNYNFLNQ